MLSIIQTRTKLIEAISAIAAPNNFKEVIAFPIGLAIKPDLDKVIFDKHPHLQLPACLVVLVDGDDSGKRKERELEWALVVVAKDDTGHADAITLPRVDAIRALEGTQLISKQLWLKLDASFTNIDCQPAYSLVGLSVTTREYVA